MLTRESLAAFLLSCAVLHHSVWCPVIGGHTTLMMGLSFNEKFPRETWTLYGFGILVIFVRLWVFAASMRWALVDHRPSSISRVRKLGITKLQADDYIMVNATFWYTLLAVSINKMIAGGGSNFMTPEDEASLTPQTVKERMEGSKWVFVSEQGMIITIWSLKLCMLFIYRRLTYVASPSERRLNISIEFSWSCSLGSTEHHLDQSSQI